MKEEIGKGRLKVTVPHELWKVVLVLPHEGAEPLQKLAKALQDQLSGVKVYKVGDEAERDVYIAGKTADGRWAGLKTTVVET